MRSNPTPFSPAAGAKWAQPNQEDGVGANYRCREGMQTSPVQRLFPQIFRVLPASPEGWSGEGDAQLGTFRARRKRQRLILSAPIMRENWDIKHGRFKALSSSCRKTLLTQPVGSRDFGGFFVRLFWTSQVANPPNNSFVNTHSTPPELVALGSASASPPRFSVVA